MESEFGISIRELIKRSFKIKLLIDFRDYKIFGKGIHSVIFIAQKLEKKINILKNEFDVIVLNQSLKINSIEQVLDDLFRLLTNPEFEKKNYQKFKLNQAELGLYWQIEPKINRLLTKKISDLKDFNLESIAEIKEGINSGADKVSERHLRLFDDKKPNIGEGIFVLSSKELDELKLSQDETKTYIKRWIKGRDIQKWTVNDQNNWLIYFKHDISKNKTIFDHLKKYKNILENRAEIKRNPRRKWYELAWPRSHQLFETTPKLLIRYKAKKMIVAIDKVGYFTSADFRILTVKKPFNSYVILGILNSELINWQVKNRVKKLGSINDYYSYVLKEIPIIYPSKEIEEKIIIIVNQIVSKSINGNIQKEEKKLIKQEHAHLENQLNQIVFKLYGITKEEQKVIENTYKQINPNL